MVAEAVTLKNVLMVYSGGGMDGCIWEVNLCLWDKEGQWHDVYSSGYSGLKTQEKAEEEYQWSKDHEDSDEYRDSKVMHIIDLDKEDDFNQLQNYETVMLEALLRMVNEKLAMLNQPMVAWFECSMCNKKHYPWSEEPGYPEDLKGNGGVGLVGNKLICPECYHAKCCMYCGEYDEYSLNGYCRYCHEKAFNHFLKSLNVGSIKWNKSYVDYNGKKEWIATSASVIKSEDFDPDWWIELELEASDFKKPENLDPETEYLWVVTSNDIAYFIRAKTSDEAASDCTNILGSCSKAQAAWDAFEFDVEAEHEAARIEEQSNRK